MKPELIVQYDCLTGEGPLWHPFEKKVYWIDIPTGRIFWFDPATRKHEMCYKGEVSGGITIQQDGSFLLFQAHGAIRHLSNGKLATLLEEIPNEFDYRFNDVIADPRGGVFCGTMDASHSRGTLYRLSANGKLKPFVHNVGCSNGLGFSPDLKTLYFTETRKLTIWAFDYDLASNEAVNQRRWLKVDPSDGRPDGLTVDAEGFIWSARWDGSCIVRLDPDGKEERRIQFPCRKVSSLIFGGEEFTDIYVTTACVGREKEDQGYGAGGLFHLNLGIKGKAEFLSQVQAETIEVVD